MNRFSRFFLLTLASISTYISADDLDDTVLTFTAGYRRDSISITAHNPDGNSNIVNKHTWDDVGAWYFGIGGWTFTEYNIFFKGYANWGKVVNGNENVEATLIRDGSFHQHDVRDSFTYDASIAIGFPVWFTCFNDTIVIPLIGYSWERLELGSHAELFTGPGNAISLKTHDHTFWLGPWAGIDVRIPLCFWHLYGGYEYHWDQQMRCLAKFKQGSNFTYKLHQRSTGIANVGRLGVGYQFWDDWDALFTVNYWDFHAKGGHSRQRLTNSTGIETTTRTKLKTAHWNSWEFQLDLNLLF